MTSGEEGGAGRRPRARRRLLGGARPNRGPTDAAPPPDDETTLPGDPVERWVGRTVGPWRVDEVVARSQGSCLVRATHPHSDRIRASLRVLEDPSPEARARLVHEGQLLFPLRHPALPSVRNVTPDAEPPWLELELVRGECLTSLLARRRALFASEALDLVDQLLAALAHLHALGIAHRDVQPRNLIIGRDGVLALHGFAWAGPVADPDRAPVPDALPWQPPDAPTAAPTSADVYAAGVVLYEALTGQRPFYGAPSDGPPLVRALVAQDKASLPHLDPGPGFSDEVRAAVRGLTTREASGRPADAAIARARLGVARPSAG